MNGATLLLTFICISCINTEKFDITGKLETVQKLKTLIENPPRKAWSYNEKYGSLSEMRIVTNTVNKAIVNDGYLSRASIKRQFLKSLRGDNISFYIFGESVSIGAGLGPSNQNQTYHYSLAHWWNNTIGKITGSMMTRRIIAVGGVSSNYFSRCWREYLQDGEEFDIAIWEFNINDAKENNLKKTLEIFTRSFYKRFMRIDLLFAVFYRSNYFDGNERRHEISEELVLENAQYYNLTCFNIEVYVNNSLFNVDIDDMFAPDDLHASVLAHAQMALIIVRYYINTIYELATEILDQNNLVYNFVQHSLPPPKHIIRDNFYTICWNAVLPKVTDTNRNNHLIFSLKNNRTRDFQIQLSPLIVPEVRTDLTGGYETETPGGSLNISFEAVSSNGLCDVAVGLRYSNLKSVTEITLYSDDHQKAAQKIINARGREDALYIDYISTVIPGQWTISFVPVNGGLLLSAILVC